MVTDKNNSGSGDPKSGKDVEDDNCVHHSSLFANVIDKKSLNTFGLALPELFFFFPTNIY